jgi:hypothetical protein
MGQTGIRGWFIGGVAGKHCASTFHLHLRGEKVWQVTRGRVFLRACPVSLPCNWGDGFTEGGISASAVGRVSLRALATLAWHAD